MVSEMSRVPDTRLEVPGESDSERQEVDPGRSGGGTGGRSGWGQSVSVAGRAPAAPYRYPWLRGDLLPLLPPGREAPSGRTRLH